MPPTYTSSLAAIINAVYKLKPEITKTKLEYTLYFLFAYYSSDKDANPAGHLLFDATFEAWPRGPVIKEDISQYPNHNQNEDVKKLQKETNLWLFITDLCNDINQVGGFTLINRSRNDQSWKKTFRKQNYAVINHTDIINDYKK